jgi:hypothetical protein
MHGGIKVYRGTAAAARNYLDADRSRADDYYLAEGSGVARRFTAGPDGPVVELAPISGDGYEAWVAGLDPDTNEPRGRLRTDDAAVRFVEVIVNGPKSWSLAAELHPDVAAAYEVAQDRAAEQIIGWLGQHATTRVGPRDAQVAVPVERLEAVTVRHYSSRAGDPHRHLHLQVNVRVFAAGKWRGLDTVAFRDSIAAVNGIGHAAVACDPDFRAALAAHGYTLTETGELEQLAPYVGAFSKRAAQIAASLDRYEVEWRREHPGQEPSARLRRSWDARAWAEDRPDKVVPTSGAELRQRWLDELAALGHRDRDKPRQLALALPGTLDRDAVAREVVARLGAGRSAWNAADVRGEVELLLARTGVVADRAVRGELAEDLIARVLAACAPLLDRDAPEHVRALTSYYVLDVEDELVGRLAARAPVGDELALVADDEPVVAAGRVGHLDAGQHAAVVVLAGDEPLVVIEGAAGAGKTTMLATARETLDGQGRQMVIVTPTLKAAQVAGNEIGTPTSSAARLAYRHGWRWDEHGHWTRLRVGAIDSVTGRTHTRPTRADTPARGSLLVVDEAGMLDQDTARALLTVADEHGWRIALVGDRHQLPAVGRGGVLEHASRWVQPIVVDTVHRFVRATDGESGSRLIPDAEYAQLSRAMRTGDDPAAVFDALTGRGQIRVHGSAAETHAAIADAVLADRHARRDTLVIATTLEQVAALNTVIRDRLVSAGLVDDRHTVSTLAGERIGRGDRIATRRNDAGLDVANRETWTVAAVHRDGTITVRGRRGERELPASYVERQAELAYATTAHGAQGTTSRTAHLLLDEHATAATAYVGMTRGRHANTAHLIAANPVDAREQWVATFARDRADLGPAAARDAAGRAAAGYSTVRPLADVLAELRAAWSQQLAAHWQLDHLQEHLDHLQARAGWEAHCRQVLDPLETARDAAHATLERAEQDASGSFHILHDRTERYTSKLRHSWDTDMADAGRAADTIAAGPGRLGIHRHRVADAQARLDAWTDLWAEVLTGTAVDPGRLQAAPRVWRSDIESVGDALDQHARRLAAADHPEHAAQLHTARQARELYEDASTAYHQARAELSRRSSLPVYDTGAADQLPELTERVEDARQQVDQADQRVDRLAKDPAIASNPNPAAVLQDTKVVWLAERAFAHRHAAARAASPFRSLHHDPAPPTRSNTDRPSAADPGSAPARRTESVEIPDVKPIQTPPHDDRAAPSRSDARRAYPYCTHRAV